MDTGNDPRELSYARRVDEYQPAHSVKQSSVNATINRDVRDAGVAEGAHALFVQERQGFTREPHVAYRVEDVHVTLETDRLPSGAALKLIAEKLDAQKTRFYLRSDESATPFPAALASKDAKGSISITTVGAPRLRTWTSSSGKYTVRAIYLGDAEGKVELLRTDTSKTIGVALASLSEKDREYVEALRSSVGRR